MQSYVSIRSQCRSGHQPFLENSIDDPFKADEEHAKGANNGWYIYMWAFPINYT
jgi:hypothetical protein